MAALHKRLIHLLYGKEGLMDVRGRLKPDLKVDYVPLEAESKAKTG
jgi:hypothetical protein